MSNNKKSTGAMPDFRKIFELAEHYSEASHLLAEYAKGEKWKEKLGVSHAILQFVGQLANCNIARLTPSFFTS